MLENIAKLGLSDQECLQQRLLAKLEVGQHSQLFYCARRQILRFVDDQQAALAFSDLCHKECLDRHQQIGFGNILDTDTKGSADHAQCVLGIKLGADQIGGRHRVGVHAVEQASNDCCLACADLSGNNNKTFVPQQAILKVRLGAPMLLAAEIEARIRIELKRLAGQPIKSFVHESELHIHIAEHSRLGVRRSAAIKDDPPCANTCRGILGESGRKIDIDGCR